MIIIGYIEAEETGCEVSMLVLRGCMVVSSTFPPPERGVNNLRRKQPLLSASLAVLATKLASVLIN